MSKKTDPVRSQETSSPATRKTTKKADHLKDLEQRLLRLEKRTKNNERFARTFSGCLDTQVLAIDAVTSVMRRALREDATIHDELWDAIKRYDRHKVHRWFSGFCGVLFRVLVVAVAGFMGAFIYWVFCGK